MAGREKVGNDLQQSEESQKAIVNENEEVNALIDKMTLFDDALMSYVFDDNIPATEELLRIILGHDIHVESVKGQEELKGPRINGRKITVDIKAVEKGGNHIDIEVQNDSGGSSVKRARFHSSMLDSRMLGSGQEIKELKDSYVIFIYSRDKFRKGLPVYHLERVVKEIGKDVCDGSHIVYVNGKYTGNDEIGKLIADFKCKNPSDMYYKELADGVRYFKETEEGRKYMSKAIEEYANRKVKEATKKARGEAKKAKEEAKKATINATKSAKLEAVKNLIETMNLSLEKALDVLRIMGDERTFIESKLMK